jgi:transcriptional regulator with XRE-family HTH domain
MYRKVTTTTVLSEKEFDSFVKALGMRIRTIRREKNVNMRDIMIETGFYDSQWRKYESGGGLNLRSLMKVAQGLKVTLAELLDGLGQWPQLSVEEIQRRNHIVAQSELNAVLEAEPVILPKHDHDQRMKEAKGKVVAKKKASKPAVRSPKFSQREHSS